MKIFCIGNTHINIFDGVSIFVTHNIDSPADDILDEVLKYLKKSDFNISTDYVILLTDYLYLKHQLTDMEEHAREYFKYYIDLISRGYNVIVWGNVPFYGCNEYQIKNEILVEWNNHLKKLCDILNVPFLSITKYLIDDNYLKPSIVLPFIYSELHNILNINIEYHKSLVSIVMAYTNNRKDQTITTLNRFEELYYGKYNFEVIIVDDASNECEKLDDIIKKYKFDIKLINITQAEKGDRINPCVAYNKGFKMASGDIIIIQNPECYHVNDIIGYTLNNLTEQKYFSYSCFASNSHDMTKKVITSENIIELINNIVSAQDDNSKLLWYTHPFYRNIGYHFCSAIYKSKLDLMGGFDERFADGYGFDDDELMLSIINILKLDVNIIKPEDGLVIHQFHIGCGWNSTVDKKWVHNRDLFKEMKSYHLKYKFQYPKLLHLYWDGSPMSYLNYLTILSFNEYHKNWKINIYMPIKRTETISWSSDEQKLKYTSKCYFNDLKLIPNVILHYIDFDKIGFTNDASEVIKSDYLRYYLLYKHGGVWSDFDIIYTGSIEEKMNFNENTVIFRCISDSIYKYYQIGFFICKPQNVFFKYLSDQCAKYYNKNEYQSIGASMILKLFNSDDDIYQIDKSIRICGNEYYLPWAWNELDELLIKKK